MQPLVFILGATASGKTQLALHLDFDIEIISIDSALIYRDMDIGTAKPTLEERARVPHHLIDICPPEATYSVAQFCADTKVKIAEISARGKLPVFVGGTMMYVKALREGLADLPSSQPEIRQQIQSVGEARGWATLHQQLAQIDPETAARLAPQDSQRITRALEVWQQTGRTMSDFLRQSQGSALQNPHLLLNLQLPRAVLHERIAARFSAMLEAGFLQEMRDLRRKYPNLHEDLPSMRCVGYRQAWAFLDGKISEADFIAQGIAATRQLAKRQETWLRSLSPLQNIDATQKPAQQQQIARQKIQDFLEKHR